MSRLLDISVHLFDQGFPARVLHLAAQPGIEVDRDLGVV